MFAKASQRIILLGRSLATPIVEPKPKTALL